MINYFCGPARTGKTLSLIEVAKEKIKEGKSLLIADRNEILPKVEELLIEKHYFYFTNENLKFNLIQAMMEDGKLIESYFDVFCKMLFHHHDTTGRLYDYSDLNE